MKKRPLRITIVSDGDSWMNQFIPLLISQLVENGHTVLWEHCIADIEQGDIVFYLGCGQLVPKEILKKNKHNLVVHASALPEGRGWSPLTWQIIEGKNEIPVTLFEAVEALDAGQIYLQDVIIFDGTELIDEMRKHLAEYSFEFCLKFINVYPAIISCTRKQNGEPSYYPRRQPEDSRLNPDKTIREQFNLLRVVDNKRYPAFFDLNGQRYLLKIEKVCNESGNKN
ncbi:MAG: formyltransferase family protein [Dissulfuribacterales bacterium]